MFKLNSSNKIIFCSSKIYNSRFDRWCSL